MTVNPFFLNRAWETQTQRRLDLISQKLYRATVKYQRESLLYFGEARFFAWLCGQPWAQQRYWPEAREVVQTFLRQTKLLDHNPALTIERVTQQALFGSCFSQRWFPRLSAWPLPQLAQVIRVHGWERWLEAQQRGQGVILTHYHAVGAKLVWVWLAALGMRDLTSISAGHTAAKEAGLTYTPEITPFLHARQLHAAKACLETGGAVRILPDGFQGGPGFPIAFYQRTRSFRASFAELAMSTNATVMPVSAHLDQHGRIAITFHPPLNGGERRQPRSAQIEQLVHQYVAFLGAEWAQTPSNISLGQMRRHLAQPDLAVEQNPQERSNGHVD